MKFETAFLVLTIVAQSYCSQRSNYFKKVTGCIAKDLESFGSETVGSQLECAMKCGAGGNADCTSANAIKKSEGFLCEYFDKFAAEDDLECNHKGSSHICKFNSIDCSFTHTQTLVDRLSL